MIPRPHAVVRALLSKQPFVAAKVFPSRLPSDKLAASIYGLIQTVESTVKTQGFPPHAGIVELNLPDGSIMRAKAFVGKLGSMCIEAETRASLSPACLAFEVSSLTIKTSMQSHIALQGGVSLAASGGSFVRSLLRSVRKRKLVDAFCVQSNFRIAENSLLKCINFSFTESHPDLVGGSSFKGAIKEISIPGGRFGIDAVLEKGATKRDIILLPSIDVAFGATAFLNGIIDEGDFSVSPAIGPFCMRCSINGDPQEGVKAIVTSQQVNIELSDACSFTVLPNVCATLRQAHGGKKKPKKLTTLDFKGTTFDVVVDESAIAWDDFTVDVEEGAHINISIENAVLNVSGLGRCVAAIAWDFPASPTIAASDRTANLLVPQLLKGTVRGSVDMVGGISFDAPKGTHLSILLNPAKHPDALLQTLDKLSLVEALFEIARVLDPATATLQLIHGEILRAREMLRSLGIQSVRQAIPKDAMAEVASRILGVKKQEFLDTVLSPIIAGRSFSVRRVKRLIEPFLEES